VSPRVKGLESLLAITGGLIGGFDCRIQGRGLPA